MRKGADQAKYKRSREANLFPYCSPTYVVYTIHINDVFSSLNKVKGAKNVGMYGCSSLKI